MKHWLLLFMLISLFSSLHAKYDIKKGRELAQSQCQACHGATGHSPNPIWPSLAGQHAEYLIEQLLAFKEGKKRNNKLMTPLVAQLSRDDINNLAAFFSSQKPVIGFAKKKNLKRGELLYRGGNFTKGITACIACHGPTGHGNEQAGFPSLQGQQAAYIIDELEDFEEGERKNKLSHIMQVISKKMSKKDRAAVANYIQGLH